MSEDLPRCSRDCLSKNRSCADQTCRMWIDYEEDNNCTLITISDNGPMTLAEIAKRMKISLVRVSQIEKESLKKLSKRIKM
jgi:DNA-directed RNA polymerase sigma subunit (sigma70/sigma32)